MSDSVDYMRGWLRGFFDGEGWAVSSSGKRRSGVKKTYHTICVGIGNTDAALMERCTSYLRQLGITGIKPRVRQPKNGRTLPFFYLFIQGAEEIERFDQLVGFTSLEKRRRMAEMIAHIRRRRAIKEERASRR